MSRSDCGNARPETKTIDDNFINNLLRFGSENRLFPQLGRVCNKMGQCPIGVIDPLVEDGLTQDEAQELEALGYVTVEKNTALVTKKGRDEWERLHKLYQEL